MARKVTADTPTDEEIWSYNNVPVEVAAKYIGWSSCNIAYALQQERAPYGHAAVTGEKDETGAPTYSYSISPGLLVAYKRGTLEAWRLSGLVKVLTTEVSELIEKRIANLVAMFAMTAKKSA